MGGWENEAEVEDKGKRENGHTEGGMRRDRGRK